MKSFESAVLKRSVARDVAQALTQDVELIEEAYVSDAREDLAAFLSQHVKVRFSKQNRRLTFFHTLCNWTNPYTVN